jgi:hypothetical protein
LNEVSPFNTLKTINSLPASRFGAGTISRAAKAPAGGAALMLLRQRDAR